MNYQEAKIEFTKLFSNQMSFDEARSFLSDLYKRGENIEEITAAAETMREFAVPLNVPELTGKMIDVVGTGGDKSYTFNISTATSIVLASGGSFVAKHGNRSITSKSGSADVLEVFGINLNLDPVKQAKLLVESGFVFMFAQNHHIAMKNIMLVRKSLDHRTIFNVLGPLTNPAKVTKQLIGVYDNDLITKMAVALANTGSKSASVVCGHGNVDELTLSGVSRIATLKDSQIIDSEIDPATLGFKYAPLDALRGGDAIENAKIIYSVFENRSTKEQLDVIVLNSALAFVIDGKVRDLQDGCEMALDLIRSGKTLAKLNQIAKISSKL